ncbi:hypothetical protein [Neisseria montereyensis]|uniref:Lipoprotein n=1 Tax=Neisseria montereyensis TaxID=2973938 RepID=A0ABT2FCS5_9NEIS|nr:hypothetical protein [Neisseria montereyensis]MCS4533750.1 hypothetical protein [Neisseria montereyensis]
MLFPFVWMLEECAMFKQIFTVSAVSAALLLSACSDNNGASNRAFEKAINRYAEQQRICVPLTFNVQNSGITNNRVVVGAPQIRIVERNADGKRVNKQVLDQIDVLDDEGFYRKRTTETMAAPNGSGDVKVAVYELTDKGKKQIRRGRMRPLMCVGKQKVVKVNWFTEPTASNGLTISKVSYEVKVDAEKWAEKMLEKGGRPWDHPDMSRTMTATMVKTNDGWRNIRELR